MKRRKFIGVISGALAAGVVGLTVPIAIAKRALLYDTKIYLDGKISNKTCVDRAMLDGKMHNIFMTNERIARSACFSVRVTGGDIKRLWNHPALEILEGLI